jgi:hypothetical protein
MIGLVVLVKSEDSPAQELAIKQQLKCRLCNVWRLRVLIQDTLGKL